MQNNYSRQVKYLRTRATESLRSYRELRKGRGNRDYVEGIQYGKYLGYKFAAIVMADKEASNG